MTSTATCLTESPGPSPSRVDDRAAESIRARQRALALLYVFALAAGLLPIAAFVGLRRLPLIRRPVEWFFDHASPGLIAFVGLVMIGLVFSGAQEGVKYAGRAFTECVDIKTAYHKSTGPRPRTLPPSTTIWVNP